MRRDKTRQDIISQIGGTRTRPLFFGSVAPENLGKIWEKKNLIESLVSHSSLARGGVINGDGQIVMMPLFFFDDV